MLIMNDLEVRKIRESLGMTQAEFANYIKADVRSVQNWERGSKVSPKYERILRGITIKPRQFAGCGEQMNLHGDNINGNHVTVTRTDTERMLDLLTSKEKSLQKSQEQIDRLITMLEKITDKPTER